MEIAYAGRRSIYEELLGILSDSVIRVEYMENADDCGSDITLLDYYVDSPCRALRVGGDLVVEVAEVISGSVDDLVVGADAGSRKFGLALLSGNELLMHVMLTPRRAEALLSGLRGVLAIGDNPLGRRVARRIGACSVFESVVMVDEAEAARKRDWLRGRYPSLRLDELDAVAIALSARGGVDWCRGQKIKIA